MEREAHVDWQQEFIITNLLSISYNAWVGYCSGDRGAVICSLGSPRLGITGETVQACYVPRSRMAAFLNAWLAAPDTVILQHHHINSHILQAVDTYNPQTDAIVLIESGGQATFLYLRNLPITPCQSYALLNGGMNGDVGTTTPHHHSSPNLAEPRYEIVCNSWDKFHLPDVDGAQMRLFQLDLTH